MDKNLRTLKQARKLARLTQKEMAERLGVMPATYISYEYGTRTVPDEILDKAYKLSEVVSETVRTQEPVTAEISIEDVKRASCAIRNAIGDNELEGAKIDLAIALTARNLAIQRALGNPELDIEAVLKEEAALTLRLLT